MPSNTMPSLALSYQIALEGIYPSSSGGSGYWYLGGIRTFAGNFDVRGHASAQGQLLAISQNTALFSLYGTTYGGNGQTTFALPNFAGNVYRGAGQLPGGQTYDLGLQSGSDTANFLQSNLPGAAGGTALGLSNVETSLTARYCMNVQGVFPSQSSGGSYVAILGAVTQFGGNFAPGGTVECDGRLLQIAQNQNLYQLLGTTYGGDGVTTFAVPDLRGRTPVGSGQGPGLGNVQLGQRGGSENIVLTNANLPVEMGGAGLPVDNRSPYLALTPLISLQGVFPSRNAPITNPEDGDASPVEFQPEEATIGEIIWFAGNFAPPGWAIAQGQILSIAQNQALFSILGTTYGGNGQTTFALPDLRGRAITGVGGNSGIVLGQQFGTETFTVSMNDIPSLNISGTSADDVYYGGNLADLISGNDGNDRLTGNGGDDDLRGGAGNDILSGGGGNDTLTGGTGADEMRGGAGNDYMFVDDAGDQVFENSGEGTDQVLASASWTLTAGSHVEYLTTTNHRGGGAINLTGNALSQTIYGNAGANILNGGGGGDVMIDFGGDDFYFVNHASDLVYEFQNGGTDQVLAGISWTLNAGSYVEHLSTTDHAGTAAINLTGNELAQTLYGNNGANWLDGGGGGDVMLGRSGNDFYFVRNAADLVYDDAGNGTGDAVYAAVSWTMNAGAEIEFLATTNHGSTQAINLKGNEFNQTVYGNEGANRIDGGAGADILEGRGGADIFAFTTSLGGGNIDTITDFAIGVDKLGFAGVTQAQLAAGGFRTGTSALDADDRILYDQATGRLFYDGDGNGAGAAVQFATIAANLNLSASDFVTI